MGIRDLTTKSGKDTLQVFQDILTDIDNAADDTESQLSKGMFTNIRSTVSDSASTEVKFNDLLEDFCGSVLLNSVENY